MSFGKYLTPWFIEGKDVLWLLRCGSAEMITLQYFDLTNHKVLKNIFASFGSIDLKRVYTLLRDSKSIFTSTFIQQQMSIVIVVVN